MTPLDYDFLRKCLKERSGLVLSADKQYLVESRLLPLARKAGLAGLGELVSTLKRGNADALMTTVVEAMTTNESLFFRDKMPFEHFRTTIMPALMRRARSRVRCGSGARPLRPARSLIRSPCASRRWSAILPAGGSRSSRPICPTRCWRRRGKGSTASSRCSAGCRSSCWSSISSQVGELWQIAPISAPWSNSGSSICCRISPISACSTSIFCRNVLIYFDQATKIDLLNRLAKIVAGDGFLVLGAAETVVGLTDSFKTVGDKHGLYTPNMRRQSPGSFPSRRRRASSW